MYVVHRQNTESTFRAVIHGTGLRSELTVQMITDFACSCKKLSTLTEKIMKLFEWCQCKNIFSLLSLVHSMPNFSHHCSVHSMPSAGVRIHLILKCISFKYPVALRS